MSPAFRRSTVNAKIGFLLAFVGGLVAAAGLAGCTPEATPPEPVSDARTAAQPAAPPAPSEPPADDRAAQTPEPERAKTPSSPSPTAADGTVSFQLQPRQGVMASLVNYYKPLRVTLAEKLAEQLGKEPPYASPKPLYGTLQLGEGADNRITLVVDELEGQKPRIYIDRNNDQDLTNDGSGQWTNDSGSTLSLSGVAIDVPYAAGTMPYTFQFYRFKDRLRECVLYYRDAGREGEIASDGKPYKIAVLDENADGRFDDLDNGTVIIDLNQDGKLVGQTDSAEHHKLNEPFNVHGKVWEVASLSPDGTSISLRPSAAQVEMKAYLDPGYPAPKFTAQDLDGNPVVLGEEAASAKYVLLDFWASWCGPCRVEFPRLRRLQARYKNHGLRIIGINLDSERDKAVQAAAENQLDYRHVFDGGGWQNAVAVLYRVHGIPESFLLDRDLKIVEKGLRGSQLELRLAELLGPGDPVPSTGVLQGLGAKRVVASGWKASWSPDATRLVFGKPSNQGLQIVRIEDGLVTDLTQAGKDAAWSPDGRWIAFVKQPDPNSSASEETWIVKPDGTGERRLVKGGFPNWSADGRRLIVHDRGENKLLAIAVDDPNPQLQEFFAQPLSWYPAVSPDGNQIAFGVNNALNLVHRDTGEILLTWPMQGSRGLLPAWSPDGKYIGFGGFDNDPNGLWVVDVTAKLGFRIADGCITMPAWSPDGTRLAFDFRGPTEREVWIIETKVFGGLKPIRAD